MSKFIISKRTNGEFQFNLKAPNGEIILTSEGYSSLAGCKNGIEAVKKNSVDHEQFEKKLATNGKFYFNLKSTNGQVIGTSQLYESEQGMIKGIEAVVKHAKEAGIEEA